MWLLTFHTSFFARHHTKSVYCAYVYDCWLCILCMSEVKKINIILSSKINQKSSQIHQSASQPTKYIPPPIPTYYLIVEQSFNFIFFLNKSCKQLRFLQNIYRICFFIFFFFCFTILCLCVCFVSSCAYSFHSITYLPPWPLTFLVRVSVFYWFGLAGVCVCECMDKNK